MSVSYRQLAVSFSTADAEYLAIESQHGVLTVRFIDWQEQPVVISFPGATAFKWQDAEKLPPEIRDDMTNEVIDSSWLTELIELGATDTKHRHFKLCFNAVGVLDVVSEMFVVK